MKSFKQYLNEKYVPSNEGPLYHFVDDIGIHSVLKHNALSSITYNHPNWSPSNPSPIMISSGHVSLTRDPSLNFSGRQIRLKLDRNSLQKSGHKLEQYYDPFMHVPGDWDRDTPAYDPKIPHELKHIESEERIKGKISNLNKHLLELGITEKKYNELKNKKEFAKKSLSHLNLRKEKAKNGMFWRASSKEFRPIENERQRNVAQRSLDDNGEIHHDIIKKVNSILNHPKLKIYKEFN